MALTKDAITTTLGRRLHDEQWLPDKSKRLTISWNQGLRATSRPGR